MRKLFFMPATILLLLTACNKEQTDLPAPDELAGGATTIFSAGPDAFTFPLANMDATGLQRHLMADGAFGQQFVSAPAAQFGGLGPLYNQNACESCHVRNGKGIVPQYPADPATGLLLRLSVPGTPSHPMGIVPAPGFGGQFQHKALFGVTAEGKLSMEETEKIVQFLDGGVKTLSHIRYGIVDPYMPLPIDLLISPRNAPAVYGLGLIEAVPEADILALADENDTDGDGISGKPNEVWDVYGQKMALGRFGWKAESPTARQQSADAAHNDMGLTSLYFPAEHCDGQSNCIEGLQTGFDVDEETVDLFTFYFQTLAPPARRDKDIDEVVRGKALFTDLKCASCHKPQLVTGAHPIGELAYQIIYPYTDLLLHDMGEELADHRPAYAADGREWRTPPLWGIGLTQIVNPKATFLHDGRAKTLEEAVLWHGGEAEESREAYMGLTVNQRADLIRFLESL